MDIYKQCMCDDQCWPGIWTVLLVYQFLLFIIINFEIYILIGKTNELGKTKNYLRTSGKNSISTVSDTTDAHTFNILTN